MNKFDSEVKLVAERLLLIPLSESEAVYLQTTWNQSRFVSSADVNIDELNSQNTMPKTLSDIKILREFLRQPGINESREIQIYKLCTILLRLSASEKVMELNTDLPA